MVDKARCKFRAESVTNFSGDFKIIKLQAQYDQALSAEDAAFSKVTPSGHMEFGLSNPALEGFFVPGKTYYIDITQAD